MTATRDQIKDSKLLCREMVILCDRYLELRSHPERESEASEVKEEIMRLYGEISSRKGRVPGSSLKKMYP